MNLRSRLAWQWRHYSVTHALLNALWSLIFMSLSLRLPSLSPVHHWLMYWLYPMRHSRRGVIESHTWSFHSFERIFSLCMLITPLDTWWKLNPSKLDEMEEAVTLNAGIFLKTKTRFKLQCYSGWQMMFFTVWRPHLPLTLDHFLLSPTFHLQPAVCLHSFLIPLFLIRWTHCK